MPWECFQGGKREGAPAPHCSQNYTSTSLISPTNCWSAASDAPQFLRSPTPREYTRL